jgi:DedD protein
MRENARIRERHELSLDGRQVVSVVVGALVVLGAVFVLGVSVGRQLVARDQPPAARAESPLAALDRPAAPAAERKEKEPRLSFHDALTKGPPEGAPLPEPKAPPRPSPGAPATGTVLEGAAPLPGTAGPAALPAAGPKAAAKPAPAARPGKDAMASAVAKAASLAPATGSGPFAVQVGATRSEVEAQRMQKRLAADGAWIAAADLPGKGRWYRVRLGSFATRAEADRRLAELKARGVQGFVTDGR